MPKAGDQLQLHRDEGLQRMTWRIQRLAWLLMLGVVALSFTGLLGHGPLERSIARTDGLAVEYSRFARRTAHTALHITTEGAGRIWINRDYARRFEIGSIIPEPESIASSGDRLVYSFALTPGSPLQVVFHLHALDDVIGRVTVRAGVEPGGSVEFRQFFYP